MAMICVAVHDTEENGRTEYTRKTINGLLNTVDFNRHRLFIINNGSCTETTYFLNENLPHLWSFKNFDFNNLRVIDNDENIGTARAINKALKQRNPGEFCIKMDNDVIVHQKDWVDEMEEAITRDPFIGILGLKRKDLWQHPKHPEKQYQSHLVMLPHEPGQRWIIVEQTKDVMGTCTMFNPALLDKVGGLYQPSLYGYDDVLMCYRSNLAGFANCFLTHIHIDHIDTGGTSYADWKRSESGKVTKEVSDIVDKYISGERPIYEPCE